MINKKQKRRVTYAVKVCFRNYKRFLVHQDDKFITNAQIAKMLKRFQKEA